MFWIFNNIKCLIFNYMAYGDFKFLQKRTPSDKILFYRNGILSEGVLLRKYLKSP